MYCIPIGIERITVSEESELLQVWLFLERNGSHCIFVDTLEEAVTFATENEFPLLGAPVVLGSFIYLPVDLRKSETLASFYTWKELLPYVQPMREAWRPFLWNRSLTAERDMWGTNTYLKEIELAPSVSCYNLLEPYMALKA